VTKFWLANLNYVRKKICLDKLFSGKKNKKHYIDTSDCSNPMFLIKKYVILLRKYKQVGTVTPIKSNVSYKKKCKSL